MKTNRLHQRSLRRSNPSRWDNAESWIYLWFVLVGLICAGMLTLTWIMWRVK